METMELNVMQGYTYTGGHWNPIGLRSQVKTQSYKEGWEKLTGSVGSIFGRTFVKVTVVERRCKLEK